MKSNFSYRKSISGSLVLDMPHRTGDVLTLDIDSSGDFEKWVAYHRQSAYITLELLVIVLEICVIPVFHMILSYQAHC